MPSPHLLRIIQPFAYAIVFVALFVAEHIFPQRKELMDTKHDAINIIIGVLNAALVAVVAYYFQQFMEWVNAKGFGLMNWSRVGGLLRYAAEFLLLDVFMYWWHRLNHRLPLLWRFHAFHHLDRKMNSTTALRFHTIELMFSFAARMLFFPLMGFSVTGFLIYGIVFTSVVLFQHSAIRLPIKIDLMIRRLIVTPHMHRIHHSVIFEETDSNFSSIFPWWDALFRTYRKAPRGPIEFGVPRPHQNASPTVK